MSLLYAGVNHSLPGDGGPECTGFIGMAQRIMETAFMIPACLGLVMYCVCEMGLSLPATVPCTRKYGKNVRRCILLTLALVFGTEIGFKLASKTVVYLMNPCHVSTILQLLFLALDIEHPLMVLLFRFHIYSLSGATLALLFPVLNTRTYSLEIFLYWVQHFMIQLIPVYLFTLKGPYTVEPAGNWAMGVFSFAVLMLYHFIPMQYIGMVVEVNLNCIICPAVSDPFHGRWWRVCAIIHQFVYIPLHGKLYGLAAQYIADKYVTLSDDAEGIRKKFDDWTKENLANGHARMQMNGGDKLKKDIFGNGLDERIVRADPMPNTPWPTHF